MSRVARALPRSVFAILRSRVEAGQRRQRDRNAIIGTRKTLQDSLGDLHDVHVFSEEVVVVAEEAAASQARRIFGGLLGEETGVAHRPRRPQTLVRREVLSTMDPASVIVDELAMAKSQRHGGAPARTIRRSR